MTQHYICAAFNTLTVFVNVALLCIMVKLFTEFAKERWKK